MASDLVFVGAITTIPIATMASHFFMGAGDVFVDGSPYSGLVARDGILVGSPGVVGDGAVGEKNEENILKTHFEQTRRFSEVKRIGGGECSVLNTE